ncbi:carboxypeptidase-like regulatory domain-containing protein [Rubrivirga sp.]|uniref:carboxypeptidase-like regulatory domain-containing protein n=1 Tax=Rubrivirga sp. TaxID=1885344 RepID=UPI003B52E11E
MSPTAARRLLPLALIALAACQPARPVFVCPVGEAGWNERRLAVEILDVDDAPGGLRVVGRVTDAETSAPLVGANAVVVGTSRGAAARADGRFALDSLSVAQTVRFGFVGYAPFEVAVAEMARGVGL